MSGRGEDLFAPPAPRIYTIDAGRPFADDLARALFAAVPDPSARADCLIYTPSRRGREALIEAFARAAPEASLLPAIRAIGDVDEEGLIVDAAAGFGPDIDLPPAASRLERRLALSRILVAQGAAGPFDESPDASPDPLSPGALAAADALADLIDSLYTEEIDFERLAAVAPGECAAHWARAFETLNRGWTAWRAYLAARGALDPTERRQKLISAEAEALASKRPETPVIVAGTTGSQPATAAISRAVAQLPRGAVVLPHLDRTLAGDAGGWRAIEDAGPQAGLKALLAALGLPASAVRAFPGAGAPSPRAGLLSLALRPAEATADWRALIAASTASDPGFARAAAGLTLIEADDEDAEATAISLLLRETVETPTRTAILVTPDRDLARRVAAKMRRWAIDVEDSAGTPLAATALGSYLRLVAAWLAAPADPQAMLALARSPLAGFGLAPSERRAAVDALDLSLRGPATAEDFHAWAARVCETGPGARADPIIGALAEALTAWPATTTADFSAFLDAHLKAAEALADELDHSGAARLWLGRTGERAAEALGELVSLAAEFGAYPAIDYPALFDALIADATMRGTAGVHPRLAILGPLEARMQSADLVILGGLNEGTWPAEAATDPFLSRAMRAAAGLPSPERRIGLAAHDFMGLACAPQAALTRAKMSGGAPAKPSRWIVRLKNILAAAAAGTPAEDGRRLLGYARALDEAGKARPALAPAPRPPTEMRPRELSVSDIGALLRDPYAVYARKILKLHALEDVGDAIGTREFGAALHAAFETFARDAHAGADPAGRLMRLIESLAAGYGLDRADLELWRARLEETARWFAEFDAMRRQTSAPVALEDTGQAIFDINGRPFTLKARADRIDLNADGSAEIFDYKAGSPPTLKQQNAQFSPQLPLTALIVEEGGFPALGKRKVAGFHYLKALNRSADKANDVGARGPEAEEMIRLAKRGLYAIISLFDAPSTPYLSQPRPLFIDSYGRYDGLARRAEWAVAEDAAGDEG